MPQQPSWAGAPPSENWPRNTSWSNIDLTTITREQAKALLDSLFLGKKEEADINPDAISPRLLRQPTYGMLGTLGAPRVPDVSYGPVENFAQERAVQDALRQYPEAASRAGTISMGVDPRMDPAIGGEYFPEQGGDIDLRASYAGSTLDRTEPNRSGTGQLYEYPQAKQTILHELAHAMGLEDRRFKNQVDPTAADVSDVYQKAGYFSDIELPFDPLTEQRDPALKAYGQMVAQSQQTLDKINAADEYARWIESRKARPSVNELKAQKKKAKK